MKKIPILLSIPHGGTKHPPEIEDNLCITKHDLFDDEDPFVDEIYNLGDKVEKVISADIARAFIDLNRSLQDMPPQNPDGLIKSMTCYQKPIYIPGKEPDETLRKTLIDKYYTPYHREIQKAVTQLDLQLCLDCHSMAAVAPSISPDGNEKKRPSFCISNQDGKTCPQEMLDKLSECISESFSIEMSEISLNDPFKGGHITKTYGNNPVPWIQIEMNRDLYLSEEWFDRESLTMKNDRLEKLNHMFENCVTSLSKIWQ